MARCAAVWALACTAVGHADGPTGFDSSDPMRRILFALHAAVALALVPIAALWVSLASGPAWSQAQPASAPGARAATAAAPSGRPALTVQVTTPQAIDWPLRIAATGSIAAWQEVVVGAEVSGWRLVEVAAQVGDTVKRGQLLARLSTEMLQADMAQTRAGLAEAQAVLAEAVANADRARELQPTGVLSRQQTTQILTAEQTARARVDALQARLQADQLRLAQARIVAPDDGIVSARTALEGAVAQPGQELFRLIRRGRLEWRAEVTAGELARVKPGQAVVLTTPGGQTVKGSVRVVAPTVDAGTRNGQVLVDLQGGSDARPGMFARGEIEVGRATGLALPQTAVVLRDGFAFVLRVGADQRVAMTKVAVGRRSGERIEVSSGLAAEARVVAAGGAFLADGDLVRVVDGAPAPALGAAAGQRALPNAPAAR